jgi:hypothetical protein
MKGKKKVSHYIEEEYWIKKNDKEKLAPKCPVRPKGTRMYVWYCKEYCELRSTCVVWNGK